MEMMNAVWIGIAILSSLGFLAGCAWMGWTLAKIHKP